MEKSQTIEWGIKEAPNFVLNNLSKQATRVFSRPGTSYLVCNALQRTKTEGKNKTNQKKTSQERSIKFPKEVLDFLPLM